MRKHPQDASLQSCRRRLLFHHAVAARILTDLGCNNKNLIVTSLADLLQCLWRLLSGKHDKDHIHFVLGAVPVKYGIGKGIAVGQLFQNPLLQFYLNLL